jgi:hypothetical protein
MFVALLLSRLSSHGEEVLTQLLASAVEADLGGRLRDPELCGNGFVR